MANDSNVPTETSDRRRDYWGLQTTGKQVELLLHVTALVLIEGLLFLLAIRSTSGPPGRDMAGGKLILILIMVAVGVTWGMPLFFMFRHTRLSLRSCLVFVTVMACLIAGINYLAIFVPK